MVGFEVQMHGSTFLYVVGDGGFLGSFFDTITYRLEKGKRGAKYPVLKSLYDGETVYFEKLHILKKELTKIRKKLQKYSPAYVVWDIEDLSVRPPWGDKISEEITDLSNYFVTARGKQLFDILDKAIEHACELKTSIKVKSTFEPIGNSN